MRSLLMAAGALTLLCGAALAQTSTSGSNSNANVDTTSGSRSNSISNPQVNVYGNPIGNGASSSNSSAGGRSNSNSRSGAAASSGRSSSDSQVIINNNTSSGSTGGSSNTSSGTSSGSSPATTATANGNSFGNNSTSTTTLRNTPEIIAPSIIGGNPCTVGASGGVSLPGFGIVTGGSWEGKACERRQLAALLYNIGHGTSGAKGGALQDAAVEVLCVDPGVRSAFMRIGQPCVGDRGVASTAASSTGLAAPKTKAPVATASLAPRAVTSPRWSSADHRGRSVSNDGCTVSVPGLGD